MDHQIGSSMDYFVLCGDGSCSNIKFKNVRIVDGGSKSSCNFPAVGCPGGIGINGTHVSGGGVGPRVGSVGAKLLEA